MPADTDRRVYADGSALSRYLPGAPFGPAWRAWAAQHEPDLVTSPLGVSELRGTARPFGASAVIAAHEVTDRVHVLRFSDQAVERATDVAGVAPPFVALHVGTVLAEGLTSVATYDLRVARLAAVYGLEVVTPGRSPRWWEADPEPWVQG
ncbi:hypothetical protein [Cellulomonas sp. HZM]|uniref:hypothetical protein n=1 Tax=Cellulomonas sp. HZM TaxID=1454010 RepID=UPI0004938EAA|nr:hypothetical protein [Cellulomonas sp. HZM]